MTASGGAWLFGVLSLDIYVERGAILPGGGVLNMAWHSRIVAFDSGAVERGVEANLTYP